MHAIGKSLFPTIHAIEALIKPISTIPITIARPLFSPKIFPSHIKKTKSSAITFLTQMKHMPNAFMALRLF